MVKFSELYNFSLINQLKMSLVTHVTRTYGDLPKFVFLCGKQEDDSTISNRTIFIKYFSRKADNTYRLLLAENFLDYAKIDLLTFEKLLAEISDLIVLYLESMGTASELGAFSTKTDLNKKMIVINEKKYENINSFLTKGPIRKVMNDSDNKNVIYVEKLKDFSKSKEFEELIKKFIDNKYTLGINKDKENVRVKSYIMELIDLIRIAGPIKACHLSDLYKSVKGFDRFDWYDDAKWFQHRYAIDILINSQIIKKNQYDYLFINYDVIPKDCKYFMFSFDNLKQADKIRLKFLNKKQKLLDPDEYKLDTIGETKIASTINV